MKYNLYLSNDAKSDAISRKKHMRPPEYLLREESNVVDLTKYPDKSMRRQLLGGEEIAIPDLHASAEKMVFQLILDGILDISESDYYVLLNIFRSDTPLTKPEYETLKTILFERAVFEIDKLGLQLYIGDMVSDRRKNDLFILIILTAFTRAIKAWYRQKNPTASDVDAYNAIWSRVVVKLITTLGNHDGELLRNYFNKTLRDPKTAIGLQASASMQALAKSIRDGVITEAEVNEMIAESYLPHLRIYSFSMNSLHDISGFGHAFTDLLDVRNLHLLFKGDGPLALDDPGHLKDPQQHVSFALSVDERIRAKLRANDLTALIPTIDQASGKTGTVTMKIDDGNGEKEVKVNLREFVLLRFLWERHKCQSFSAEINYAFMMNHGHNNSGKEATDQTHNLDRYNQLGIFAQNIRGPLIRRVAYFRIEPSVFLRIAENFPALFSFDYRTCKKEINYRKNLAAALYSAAGNGDVEVAKVLILQEGIDIDATNDTTGLTALGVAQQQGQQEIVKVLTSTAANLARIRFNPAPDLIQQEAEILIQYFPWEGRDNTIYLFTNQSLANALLQAARYKIWDVVEKLLQLRVKPLCVCKETGYSVLHYAVLDNQRGIITLLCNSGVNINSQHNPDLPTPLICAAESRSVTIETFRYLLQQATIDINIRRLGKTALYIAAEQGDAEKVSALLTRDGIDTDAKSNLTCQTGFQVAKIKLSVSLGNDEETSKLLVEMIPWQNKAVVIKLLPPNIIVKLLPKILDYAFTEDIDLLFDLLSRSPDGLNQLINGATLLHHAVERFREDLLVRLLNGMADITIKMSKKDILITPLQYATDLAIHDQTAIERRAIAWKMVLIIAKHNQNFNAGDNAGCAHALVTAAKEGSWRVVSALIAIEVLPTGFFKATGYSAFHFAVLANNIEMIDALVAAKANVNFYAAINQPTPLVLAARSPEVTMSTFEHLLGIPGIDIHLEVDHVTALSAAYAADDFKKMELLLNERKSAVGRVNGFHAEQSVVSNGNSQHDKDRARAEKYTEYLLRLLNNRVPKIEELMSMRDLHDVLSMKTIARIIIDLKKKGHKEERIRKQNKNIVNMRRYLEDREGKIWLPKDFFSDNARLEENMEFYNSLFNLANDQMPEISPAVRKNLTEENKPLREKLRYFLFSEFKGFLQRLPIPDAVTLAQVRLTYLLWAKKQDCFVKHTTTGFFATFGSTDTEKEIDEMIEAQIYIIKSRPAPQP